MEKTNASSKMFINVITGRSENGEVLTKRTISKINPELSDEDFYAAGRLLGSLQGHDVKTIIRQDSATINA